VGICTCESIHISVYIFSSEKFLRDYRTERRNARFKARMPLNDNYSPINGPYCSNFSANGHAFCVVWATSEWEDSVEGQGHKTTGTFRVGPQCSKHKNKGTGHLENGPVHFLSLLRSVATTCVLGTLARWFLKVYEALNMTWLGLACWQTHCEIFTLQSI